MLFTVSELANIGVHQKLFNQWHDSPVTDFNNFITFHNREAIQRLKYIISDTDYASLETIYTKILNSETITDDESRFFYDLQRVEMNFTAIEMIKADDSFTKAVILPNDRFVAVSSKTSAPTRMRYYFDSKTILNRNGYDIEEYETDFLREKRLP